MSAREARLVAGIALAVGGLLGTVSLVGEGAAVPGPERTEHLLLAALSGLVAVVGVSTWGATVDVLRARWVVIGLAVGAFVVLPVLLWGLPNAVEALVRLIDR